MGPEDVIFVGKNLGVVSWYRTGMPALELGSPWISVTGKPGELWLRSSLGVQEIPDLADYKIVILQQVEGIEWAYEITRLRSKGVKVIYEVDDYLHGVREIRSHRAREVFSEERMSKFELCMRVCDAMICSTEWLAEKYAEQNPRVFVCKNAIDGKRYEHFKLPKRDTLNIGWAGGEGHLESVMQWMPAIKKILSQSRDVRFISIGLQVANILKMPEQALALPFVTIENFPGALCNFDIAIAPAGREGFFAAKSDLRWLETGALGIPLVADPFVYGDIDHDLTGYLAETADEAYTYLRRLVTAKKLRREIGQNARARVLQDRSIETGIEQWIDVFKQVG